MKTYTFYDQPGAIPGIAGVFANCIVKVDEEHREVVATRPLGEASKQASAPTSSPDSHKSPKPNKAKE